MTKYLITYKSKREVNKILITANYIIFSKTHIFVDGTWRECIDASLKMLMNPIAKSIAYVESKFTDNYNCVKFVIKDGYNFIEKGGVIHYVKNK